MKLRAYGALAAAATLALAGCGAEATHQATDTATVTVTNCEQKVDFPSPAQRLFVNDSNLMSMVLALGAEDQVAAASSISSAEKVLEQHYGAGVKSVKQVSDDYPSLETVIAAKPDVMVAGWSYGYDESTKVTPGSLATHDIAAYVLTESCRQADGKSRGIVDPWTALREDMTNLGEITGEQERAAQVVADFDKRLEALAAAPSAPEKPSVFVFDSGEKAVFTSGVYGAPNAIIEAGGGVNAMSDVEDTWTEVSWERLAAAKPDAFVFVDYPGQTLEQKIAVLKANPATRDLPAVKEGRFLNLPYALWTSGPLNIDAAEQLRASLEEWRLAPTS